MQLIFHSKGKLIWISVSQSDAQLILFIFSNIIEFWKCVSTQAELSGFIIDHFLGILSSSCLYESGERAGPNNQNIATHQPFAIFCALKEILQGEEIHAVS